MSTIAVPTVPVVRVEDPRMKFAQEKFFSVLKGAELNAWQTFPATNVNDGAITVVANPPNPNVGIARLVLQRYVYDVTITGTNAGASPLLVPGFFGPRAMPITQTLSAQTVTIGDQAFTQNTMNEYWPALMWYGRNYHRQRFGQYSMAPSMLDQFQTYTEGAGTNRNPLATYGTNAFEQTRGSFLGMEVISNVAGGTQSVLRITSVEPVFISPFAFGHGSNYMSAFINAATMTYTAQFSNLARVMSLQQNQGAPGVINITNVSVSVAAMQLLVNYLTPDPLVRIPRNLVTSWSPITPMPVSYGVPVAPGEVVTINFSSSQLTAVPRRIYAFAGRPQASKTAFTTDCYMSFPIVNAAGSVCYPLNLTWNNNQYLANATAQDLYNISVKNGITSSFTQFGKHVGSILCLDFGTDIGLKADEAPGLTGPYQLSLNCQYQNTGADTFIPTMWVIVVYDGMFSIVDGTPLANRAPLGTKDVLNAATRVPENFTYEKQTDVFGGGLWDEVKRVALKTHDFVKKNKLISKGLQRAGNPYGTATVAKLLGYGSGGGRSGGRVAPRRRARGGGVEEEEVYGGDLQEQQFEEEPPQPRRRTLAQLLESEDDDEKYDN